MKKIFYFLSVLLFWSKTVIKSFPKILLFLRTRFIFLFSKSLICKLKSSLQTLLSREPRYFIHLGIVLVALALAGFNFSQSSNFETVSAKENSLLANLLFSSQNQKSEIVKNIVPDSDLSKQNYLSFVSIASAAPTSGILNHKEKLSNSQKGKNYSSLNAPVLAKRGVADSESDSSLSTNIKMHTVTEGETISYIAQLYGVDAATILSENNLYADDIIKPGMELTILPISGTSEKVDEGETLTMIAQRYEVDEKEVMKYNKLLVAKDIEVGQVLIIPDGRREIKERPRPQPPVTLAAANSTVETSDSLDETTDNQQYYDEPEVTSTSATPTYNLQPTSNAFSWGWCTWYAAARRPDVTWMGNAGEWLYNAQSQGRATGRIPAVGAILVTNESWWGHVGIVEEVNGDSVTISEMNYQGFGVISSRTISNRNGVIKGYIY